MAEEPLSKRILQSTETAKTKSITLKLPAALHQELQEFKAELHRVAPNLIFNASAICAEALEDALKKARKELEALKAEQGGKQQGAEGQEAPGQSAGSPETSEAGQEAGSPAGSTMATPAQSEPEPEQRRGLFR